MACSNPAITCDLQSMDFMTLLKSLIGKDANDCFYVRYIDYSPAAGERGALTCNGADLDLETLIRNSIVLDAQGRPALRMGLVT